MLSISAVFWLLNWHSRRWHPLWAGDLGFLPYQSMRMAWGETLYRDFAAKNPLGVFVVPALVMRAMGTTMDAYALLVSLQFCFLLVAMYLVARRTSPATAWLTIPLYLDFCLRNCGLIHHVWAGAIGLLCILGLYDCLFRPDRKQRPWAAGFQLAVSFLFHQLLAVTLTASVLVYSVGFPGPSRVGVRKLGLILVSALCTVFVAYGCLALLAGPDWSLFALAFKSTVLQLRHHQSVPFNNPLLMTDLPVGLTGTRGWAFWLELARKGLAYFGFPVLASLLIRRGRLRPCWLSWLLLSASLVALSSYPQFISSHLRAFLIPYSLVLVARQVNSRRWGCLLAPPIVLACALGLLEAWHSVADATFVVQFPAGAVYFGNSSEAAEFQSVVDTLAREKSRRPLLIYPYFTMGFFLFQRANPMKIHELTPALLIATGVKTDDPIYQEGMRAVIENPPEYALYDLREENRLRWIESQLPPQAQPLRDFIHAHYVQILTVSRPRAAPWLVLMQKRL